MKETTLFDETEPVYKVINHAYISISELKKGFYDSIFTPQFEALDFEDRNLVIGVICGDYGMEIKDLVDYCIQEKMSKLHT